MDNVKNNQKQVVIDKLKSISVMIKESFKNHEEILKKAKPVAKAMGFDIDIKGNLIDTEICKHQKAYQHFSDVFGHYLTCKNCGVDITDFYQKARNQ